jgi:hypothetical protein
VDGEIRIGVGKCLRISAYFGLLFGIPAATLLAMTGLRPPIGVYWLLGWCVGQAVVGSLIHGSGRRARRRLRGSQLNVAIERAVQFG